jgi:Arc/MetJ-type ribon-helix-helix transcriptional regulator
VSGEKAMTLRISTMQALAIESIAKTEEKSQSDVVREAITNYVEQRKADPEFQKRLKARMDENNALLRRMCS